MYKRVNDIQVKPPPIYVRLLGAFKTSMNNLFLTNFPNVYIVGKKDSGKTNLILNMLDEIVNEDTIIIIFCNTVDISDMWRFICNKYGGKIVKYKNIVDEDEKTGKEINNLQAFIKRMEKSTRNEENNNYVVIFDDISDELRNKYVKKYLKQNKHYKAFNIISTQGAKDLVPTAVSQINYCILLNGIPEDSLNHIHKNLSLSISSDKFKKMYNDITSIPFNFLYMDCDRGIYRRNFDLEYNNNYESNSDISSDSSSSEEGDD